MSDGIIEFLKSWGLLISFLGMIGIEIVPVKVNPISWILKRIGNIANKDLCDRIDKIDEKVTKLERDSDFKDILDIKQNLSNYKVLLADTGLDENQYRRCFELEMKYNEYKNKYPGEVNGHMDAIMEFIHEHYKAGFVLQVDAKLNKKKREKKDLENGGK